MRLPLRRRRRWDAQPAVRCEVLLASDGGRGFSDRAIAEAAALAASGPVAVLTVAKIYGSAYGMPNPGLLPTRGEVEDRHRWVNDAIGALERGGVSADGQVAATRRAARLIARVARLRGARVVVMDETAATGWRRRIEGDLGRDVARRLRRDPVEVVIVPRGPRTASGSASTPSPTRRRGTR